MQALQSIKPIITRLAIVFTALALYVYAGLAIAQPAPPRDAPPGPDGMFRHACANGEAMFRARMAFIEAKLDLTAEQKPAFAAFVAESQAAGQPMRDLCRTGLPTRGGRTVDRLKAMQSVERTMAEVHQGLIAATEKLDAVLTGEQDKALAEAMLPHSPIGAFHGPRPLP